jgi:hypothetical protein
MSTAENQLSTGAAGVLTWASNTTTAVTAETSWPPAPDD